MCCAYMYIPCGRSSHAHICTYRALYHNTISITSYHTIISITPYQYHHIITSYHNTTSYHAIIISCTYRAFESNGEGVSGSSVSDFSPGLRTCECECHPTITERNPPITERNPPCSSRVCVRACVCICEHVYAYGAHDGLDLSLVVLADLRAVLGAHERRGVPE